MLGLELAELSNAGFDLGLTGFTPEEWDALIAGEQTLKNGLTGEDEVPEVVGEPITRPGDLWLLGEHKLLCGDPTTAATTPHCWTTNAPTWPSPIRPTT